MSGDPVEYPRTERCCKCETKTKSVYRPPARRPDPDAGGVVSIALHTFECPKCGHKWNRDP